MYQEARSLLVEKALAAGILDVARAQAQRDIGAVVRAICGEGIAVHVEFDKEEPLKVGVREGSGGIVRGYYGSSKQSGVFSEEKCPWFQKGYDSVRRESCAKCFRSARLRTDCRLLTGDQIIGIFVR